MIQKNLFSCIPCVIISKIQMTKSQILWQKGTCMDSKFENGQLTIFLEGRVDSSNASAVEAELQSMIAGNPATSLVLDAEKLEYISSAGLRIVLRLRKQYEDMKVINASAEVYDIFDMTGFTEMLTVEKAYRRMSVEGCEVIGEGANGKVYRIDPDTIVKVYLNPDSLPDIHRERELARKAFVLGIPTAISYDVVKVGEGYGSVFELLSARSIGKRLIAAPEKWEEYTVIMVDLLKKIHSTVVKRGDMPDMKEVALGWANFMRDYLPAAEGEKLVALVNAVPQDDHMMHGDYHIKNVMLQGDEALLIDMDTLCVGHPVFELASVYNAYLGFGETDHSRTKDFLGIDYEIAGKIWNKTLELYLDTTDPARLAEVADKARIVGYTRLIRRSIRRGGLETDKETLDYYTEQLIGLLQKTDTLVF